jgi:hypothetical protein
MKQGREVLMMLASLPVSSPVFFLVSLSDQSSQPGNIHN